MKQSKRYKTGFLKFKSVNVLKGRFLCLLNQFSISIQVSTYQSHSYSQYLYVMNFTLSGSPKIETTIQMRKSQEIVQGRFYIFKEDFFKSLAQTVNIFNSLAQTVDIFNSLAQTVDIFNSLAQTVDIFNSLAQTDNIFNSSAQTVDIFISSAQSVYIFNSSAQTDDIFRKSTKKNIKQSFQLFNDILETVQPIELIKVKERYFRPYCHQVKVCNNLSALLKLSLPKIFSYLFINDH